MYARAAADMAERARKHGQPPGDPTKVVELAPADASAASPQLRAFVAAIAAEFSRWNGDLDPTPWRAAVAAWDEAPDPYLVDPADGGNRFTRVVEVKTRGAQRLMTPIMALMIPRPNRLVVRNLKRVLES